VSQLLKQSKKLQGWQGMRGMRGMQEMHGGGIHIHIHIHLPVAFITFDGHSVRTSAACTLHRSKVETINDNLRNCQRGDSLLANNQ